METVRIYRAVEKDGAVAVSGLPRRQRWCTLADLDGSCAICRKTIRLHSVLSGTVDIDILNPLRENGTNVQRAVIV